MMVVEHRLPIAMAIDTITGLRLGKTSYSEGQHYDIASGRLDAIALKGKDYFDSLAPDAGIALTPLGMALEAMGDRLILDSRWSLVQDASNFDLPPSLGPLVGTLKIRIAALGSPSPGHRSIARNYRKINNYAIGIDFNSDDDRFDFSLLTTYSNRGGKKYSLNALHSLQVGEFLNAAKVTGLSTSGVLAEYIAQANSIGAAPAIDFNTSPFAAQFASGWPDANWVA